MDETTPTASTISLRRDVPVRREVDVLVAGGGPAGAAAAVTAARAGSRVFLAEAHTCLGGMGTAGMVPAFMTFGDGVNFLAGGFGRELLSRLEAAGGTWPRTVPHDNCCGVGIAIEPLKRVYDEMLRESGAGFLFHSQVVAVEKDGDRITGCVCAAKSGLFGVRASVYVDCTGDGDLASLAGAPFEKGDRDGNLMPGTLCSLWTDIDWNAVGNSGLSPQQMVVHAIEEGIFTLPDRHLPGIWRIGKTTGGGNVGHTFGVDGTDEESLTQALVEGRKQLLEYRKFYRCYLEGYERIELAASGSLLGIRETRRIMGDYVLGVEDFRRRAVFDDEIGRYCYPVDVHASTPDAQAFDQFMEEYQSLRYGPGESYGIPYRTLTPRNVKNLLVAGRCISTDRQVQGSVRVMPGCYVTGQAAGMAAAMAAGEDGSVRNVDVKLLRANLRTAGAFLPGQ